MKSNISTLSIVIIGISFILILSIPLLFRCSNQILITYLFCIFSVIVYCFLIIYLIRNMHKYLSLGLSIPVNLTMYFFACFILYIVAYFIPNLTVKFYVISELFIFFLAIIVFLIFANGLKSIVDNDTEILKSTDFIKNARLIIASANCKTGECKHFISLIDNSLRYADPISVQESHKIEMSIMTDISNLISNLEKGVIEKESVDKIIEEIKSRNEIIRLSKRG